MKRRTKREEFPSQKTYRKNNPSITFRLKKEDKEKLYAIIKESGKPLSRWMTDFIHDKIVSYQETSKLVKRINDLEDNIKEIENEEKFTIQCSVCGKPAYVSSTYPDWETVIYPKLKETFKTWKHKTCKSRKSP
jgi:hypothetical protein